MDLPTSCHGACSSQKARSPMASCNPGKGLASGNHRVPPQKDKQKREADRKHGIPPAERDVDEDSVMGEVEQPPPPSEKPEAS